MITRRRFLMISAAGAASGQAAQAQNAVWHGQALGASATIKLGGEAALARHMTDQIRRELATIERLFSLYHPHSALTRLNETGQLINPHPDVVALLRLCGKLHDATGGIFDPTVQPLWRAHATGRGIDAARSLVGWDRVQISEDRITLGHGQSLTLNGIAQGWASDRIAEVLRRAGFDKVLVDIGEHVGVGGPWQIGISSARGRILDHVTLRDRAIATSCPDAMRIGDAAHILTAQTGKEPLWRTVSVDADRAAIADGLSTACCFLDRQSARAACSVFSDTVTVRQFV